MRMTSLFATTLYQDPATVELVSHKLMLRAGLIKTMSCGIYTYLPLAHRVIQKISKIIREELNKVGGQELLLPILHPAQLWQETNRWNEYGEEMFKLRDRKNRSFGLGPTHEEVITDLVRREIKSYRQLPLMLYQIQTKFRDEIRPRFGVMRAREFIMKDAYSFHRNQEDLDSWYDKLYQAYRDIFTRCGLKFVIMEADSGLIGGSVSHEFMVISEEGEEPLVICEGEDYSSHLDRATSVPNSISGKKEETLALQLIETPNLKTVQEVSNFLKVPPYQLIKTLIYEDGKRCLAVLISGNDELNEKKLQKVVGGDNLALASQETIKRMTKAPLGYTGPVGLDNLEIIADHLIKDRFNMVVGANQANAHYLNANLLRDFKVAGFYDLRQVKEGDSCLKCGKKLKFYRGIEVGHVFKLGNKYSQAMKATFHDENGQEKEMIMGCYGIGVSRLVAAVIEQSHDQAGIIWPKTIAPYQILVLPTNVADPEISKLSFEIYDLLSNQGLEVIIDDRNESPGKKFKDADLIGLPICITIGNKAKESKKYEVKDRKSKERRYLSQDEVLREMKEIFKICG
ncbi:proline--tRNA ligase [bacterium]|nr:proline--tRNA ligase [bacterium]